MDGSLWYRNGGAGVFEHVSGPFAPENNTMRDLMGFGQADDANAAETINLPPAGVSPATAGEAIGPRIQALGLPFETKSGSVVVPWWDGLSGPGKAVVVGSITALVIGGIWLLTRRVGKEKA